MKKSKKTKPIKRTMSFAIFPMFAYYLMNLAASFLYVFIVAMPKLTEAVGENANMTPEEMMALYDSIVVGDTMLLLVLLNVMVIIYALWSFSKRESVFFDRRYSNKIGMKDVLVLTVLAFGLYFGVNIVLTIIIPLFGGLKSSVTELNDMVYSMVGGDLLLSVFVIGILAPVAEEFLIRGLVFNRLRFSGTVPFAVFTSALVFSMMHLPSLIQSIYTFGVGAVFAWAYYKYENILVPIILHIVYNMATFVFMIEPVMNFFSTVGGLFVFYAIGVGAILIGIKYISRKPRPELIQKYIEVEIPEGMSEDDFDVE